MPGGYKNIKPEDNTNGFQRNQQNINRDGRPRKTINSVNLELEAKGVTEATPNDIKSCYLRLINLSKEEIKELSEDAQQPALVSLVSKAIIQGKGIDIIEKVLDRAIGKAVQAQDITSGGEKIEITFQTNLPKE